MNIEDFVDRLETRFEANVRLQRLARNTLSVVLLSDGKNERLVTIYGDRLITGGSIGAPDLSWDYSIESSEHSWSALGAGEIDLMAAVGKGEVSVYGNLAKFGADSEILYALFDLADRHSGVDNSSSGTAEDWSTNHRVTGHYVDVDGIRTYYERTGSSDLPAILALHTAGRDGRQWQQVADRLAEQWQTVAIDLPGHGKSWPTSKARGLESAADIADFISKFWKAANLSTPLVVLGCSLGANLALRIGATFHDEVRGVIALQGSDYSNIGTTSGLKWMDHEQISPRSYFRPRTLSLTGGAASGKKLDYLLWEAEAYTGSIIRSDMHAYITGDSRDLTPSITCPVLMFRGGDDWMVTEEMVNSAISRLDSAVAVTHVQPEGVGHFAHVEQPELVASTISKFLDSIA